MWRLRWKLEKLLAPLGFHFKQYGLRMFCLSRWRAHRDYYGGTEYRCPRCGGAWWRMKRI